MATTDAAVGLSAAQSGGGPPGEEYWKEMKEAMALMAASIAHLSKEVGGLKAARSKSVTFKDLPPLIDGESDAKGKDLDSSADSEGEEDGEMSVAPGEDSILGEYEGLPKPTFTAAPESKATPPSSSSSSSSSTAASSCKVNAGSACVVATAYPAAWSSYLTPVTTKGGSGSSMSGTKSIASPHTKVPTRPVPVFSGAEGDDVHLWLEKVKLRGAQASWDTATLLAQASAALEGAAALWLHTAAPEVMFRFDRFEAELGRAFAPFTRVELFKEYLNCTQAEETSGYV
jgi:hypothetical protein